MSIEEYYALQIGDIVYNKETLQIVELTSCWVEGKKRKDDDSLSASIIGNNSWYAAISVKDCEKWDYVTDDSPLEVRFKMLQIDYLELKQFVYSRLR